MAFLGKKHVHCVAIPPPMNNLYFQRVWAIWQVLFLHWLTYKRKKHDLPISLFHVSSFHSPPPLLAWSSTFLRYQQPSPPEESQASLLAVVFWPNTRVYNHMFIDIYNVHIHIRYLVCNSPNHASAPTSISKKSRCFWCSGPKSQDASDQSANHEDFQGSKDQTPQGPR